MTTAAQPSRVGDRASTGGSSNNVMMDGVSTMDTGSNSPLLQMNVESIAEVKVLVSGYQAEYGRSSGIQVSAVTKSGTNKFRGSVYDVKRNSDWNSNSKTNILNGDPKVKVNEKDLGYSIGGPIGKPGGNNKLFFFYAHEFAPRTSGGDTQRYRFPTALERAGDFSQTLDNNGNLYPYIKDPLISGTCSATNTDGLLQGRRRPRPDPGGPPVPDGPEHPEDVPDAERDPGRPPYNYEVTRPEEHLMANQPAIRLDYQPTPEAAPHVQVRRVVAEGRADPRHDSRLERHAAVQPVCQNARDHVNYSLNSTTFLEGTYGCAQNSLTGCALAQGSTGPTFCRAAFPMNDIANLENVGLAGLPFLFPDAGVIDPSYFAYEALNGVKPPIWDGTRIAMVPNFAWGSRITNAPPNMPFPGYLNTNKT